MRRRRERQVPLDPEIRRELEAIDRGLAGEAVDAELAELATLASDLRGERPEPTLRFGAELDRRQQRGFTAERSSRWRRPRSYLAPAGALATLAVVAAVAITVPGGENGAGTTGFDAGGGAEPADAPATLEQAPGVVERGGEGAGTGSLEPPSGRRADESVARETGPLVLPGDGGLARGSAERKQDRSAALTLRTDTDRTREVSDQVIQITESVGGVVVSSTLAEGEDRSSATLQLSIPTRELDTTLDRLTDLATVQSLNEAAIDITKPFVSAQDRLRDARAERRQLLKALGAAETEAEAEALRKQLRDVRREISRAEAQFEQIARRARLSAVSVAIEGVPGGDDDGNWTLGDAADDALSVLGTAAGVALVAAAVLLPIVILLAAIAYAAISVRRRGRERALDD